MNDNEKLNEDKVVNHPSKLEKLCNTGMNVAEKLGNMTVNLIFGKQPTKEEKEEIQRRKNFYKKVKQVQRESEERKDLELAKQGLYVPPEPKKIKKEQNIFSNLGKHNPLEGFNDTNTIGSSDRFGLDGIGINKNPLEERRRY